MDVGPVVLTGSAVRLEPLRRHYAPQLAAVAGHDEIWTYLDEPTPETPDPVIAMVEEAMEEERQGLRLPFAIVDLASDAPIGTISFIDIQRAHRQVEIGWAWVTPSHWRTGAARESSYLLMRHAFETLGAIRIAFKTDSRNTRSQRAIEGLGATREGTFRNHRILRDGHIRHSIYYSVIAEEWPEVRKKLEARRQPEHR